MSGGGGKPLAATAATVSSSPPREGLPPKTKSKKNNKVKLLQTDLDEIAKQQLLVQEKINKHVAKLLVLKKKSATEKEPSSASASAASPSPSSSPSSRSSAAHIDETASSLLTTFEALEREESDLGVAYINCYRCLLEETQRQRRRQLGLKKAKRKNTKKKTGLQQPQKKPTTTTTTTETTTEQTVKKKARERTNSGDELKREEREDAMENVGEKGKVRKRSASKETKERTKSTPKVISQSARKHSDKTPEKRGLQTKHTTMRQSILAFNKEVAGLSHSIATWELKREEIAVHTDELLGVGAFGSVYKGELRGKPVAVKRFQVPRNNDGQIEEQTQRVLQDFRNECAVMSKLLHPNVLLLMGVCIEEEMGQLLMVTELMPRGSVNQLLHQTEGGIPFKQRMRFAKDTAFGMNWLHLSNPPILHLDLKTQNLLVDKNWVAKVADFGLSRVKKLEGNAGAAGSPAYMAPEMLDERGYNEKADVYSFGIILWELMAQKRPYYDQNFRKGIPGLFDIYHHVVTQNNRPKIEEGPETPPALLHLIRMCWDKDPDMRPSFQQILESHILDVAIVDSIISDRNELAREFWKQEFCNSEEIEEVVPWDTFLNSFIRFLGLQDQLEASKVNPQDNIYFKALKMVVANKKGMVKIEKFAEALEWFGPFQKNNLLLENIYSILSMEGFYGDLSGGEVINRMAGSRVGTYLIRFSQNNPGFYTITVNTDKSIENYRVQHRPGERFVLGNNAYDTLEDLVNAHRDILQLKWPLDNSKYDQMFKQHDSKALSVYCDITPK
ncbi:putative serine/threonine-protein kinase/receptor [Balamuthia mandrillaris]